MKANELQPLIDARGRGEPMSSTLVDVVEECLREFADPFRTGDEPVTLAGNTHEAVVPVKGPVVYQGVTNEKNC